jgi:hypothetical protein
MVNLLRSAFMVETIEAAAPLTSMQKHIGYDECHLEHNPLEVGIAVFIAFGLLVSYLPQVCLFVPKIRFSGLADTVHIASGDI